MTAHFAKFARTVADDGVVSREELLTLRREGWGDGIISRSEAEAIFAINDALDERDQEWSDFFVEAIEEYVLNGTPPRRQCSQEEAEWLIAQVERDGKLESMVELEALVRIVERAENVPDLLKDYVLDQVERAVLTGEGPTRCGGYLCANHISAAEVKILRRTIFSSGGYGPAAVSRHDAEVLFRIKDATLQADNDPSWGDLFVDGIANFLRGFTVDNAQLTHERALELNRFMDDNKANRLGFFGKLVSESGSFGRNIGWAGQALQGKDGPQNDYIGDAREGHAITDFEHDWLEAELHRDGQLDPLERRLLERLEQEGDY